MECGSVQLIRPFPIGVCLELMPPWPGGTRSLQILLDPISRYPTYKVNSNLGLLIAYLLSSSLSMSTTFIGKAHHPGRSSTIVIQVWCSLTHHGCSRSLLSTLSGEQAGSVGCVRCDGGMGSALYAGGHFGRDRWNRGRGGIADAGWYPHNPETSRGTKCLAPA